jgi:hypothetical protein
MKRPRSHTPPRKVTRPRRPPASSVPSPIDRESRSPARTREASEAMYEAMGGRDGVLALLDGVSDEDSKANALRNMLMSSDALPDPRTNKPRLSFAKMRQRAGYSAKDVFELFNDRQHATALVVAAAAKPRLVAELVDAASQRLVPCFVCSGSKRIPETDNDGEVTGWKTCTVCDEQGCVKEDGNQKARELYFGQFGFRADVPMVSITNANDNRSVTFTVGGPGTAPNPLSLIKALDQVKDVDRKMVTGVDGLGPEQENEQVMEAETV